MGNRIHVLAQQLTGKQNLDDCSLDEVKRIAQRYPYFAPAQFLLLQKLRQLKMTEEADAQYKKAVLFYPDPLQFEFFLSSGKLYEDQSKIEEQGFEPPASQTFEESGDVVEDRIQQTPAATEETESLTFNADEPEAFALQPSGSTEEFVAADSKEEEANHSPIDKAQEEPQEATVNEVPAAIDADAPATVQVRNDDAIESSQTSEVLTFEPYHTVDYFASQGIKISQEELPKDKLGKQLKSFTEWLKTMKRLPASQLNQNADAAAEKGVETLANRSVTDSEVVTEAMAEVWAKQGVPEKALDIYNKLLLHNPSKKAYFAAKIENLKQS